MIVTPNPSLCPTLSFSPWVVNDFTLKDHRIDVWEFPLDFIWPEAADVLNEAEISRAKRYRFPRHQRRFTIARAVLRMILSRYVHTPPQDLTFIENIYGKPSLAGHGPLAFNLSHSKELALLAVGHTSPMGIDLEFMSSRPLDGISQLMFSKKELSGFSQVIDPCRPLSFFHIWAQKEALIKACGMGLSYPTQQFSVPHMPKSNQLIDDPLHAKTWHMLSFMPQIGCCAALCCVPSIQELRYQRFDKDHHVFTQ